MEQHPFGERLARLETQMTELLRQSRTAHKELRQHMEWQRECFETHAARLNKIELQAKETRTHLKWMKGVWLAVQGAVLGWLGLK